MQHHVMEYEWSLVVLSFAVAYFASYTALDMGTRLRKATGKARKRWLTGSAVVLGGGIWSMHFIAMLAHNGSVAVAYDYSLTALSLLIAIAIVAVGFQLVTRDSPSIARQLGAGAIVGLGVSAMHYTGMAAVIVPGRIVYDPLIVAASMTIAIVAATAALWLTLNLQHLWQRAAAAIVMAVAVCGMHFTAMQAVSIVATGESAAAIDPASSTLLAAAVAIGVFMILCLAMVCVFVDRRFELLAEREAETLRAANAALSNSQNSIQNLLDNADQGFMTIASDLRVGDQYSAACADILGEDPAGKPIIDLLYDNTQSDAAANTRATLESLMRDTDEHLRDLKLELLAKSFEVDGRSVRASYKFLENTGCLMLVMTDVTETMRLTKEVELERLRLEMIVLAVTEGETFRSLIDDYRAFLTVELPRLIEAYETSITSGELYRRLHTYKGLLAQFSFHRSPQCLHDIETVLSETQVWTDEAAKEVFASESLLNALERDLASLADVLGDDFLASSGRVVVSAEDLQAAVQTVRELMADDDRGSDPGRLGGLLQLLLDWEKSEVKSMLGLHTRSIPALAARLEKQIGPIVIEGDDVSLSPERYVAFFRSLIHVFRNAVDHGIETPDERLAAGKPEVGAISCLVRQRVAGLEVEISDDGRGVDRQRLEDMLAAAGTSRAPARPLSLEELVFFEGLSSRDTASETSGRGVGLAAVKHELEKLGGSVEVESEIGVGARFRFHIPNEADPASTDTRSSRRVA